MNIWQKSICEVQNPFKETEYLVGIYLYSFFLKLEISLCPAPSYLWNIIVLFDRFMLNIEIFEPRKLKVWVNVLYWGKWRWLWLFRTKLYTYMPMPVQDLVRSGESMTRFKIKEQFSNRHTSYFDNALYNNFWCFNTI